MRRLCKVIHGCSPPADSPMLPDSAGPAEYVRRVPGTVRARGQEVQAWNRAHSFASPG